MKLSPQEIFHVYNRGNRRQRIFFSRANYLLFLQKVRQYWLPWCDILGYSLMPNHFHFLIKTNETTVAPFSREPDIRTGIIHWTNFSWGTRQLLTSYAKAINKQENQTGSLFTQNTKAKRVSSEWSWDDYTLWCFRYILMNPVRAGLVSHPADWEFSAYRDFAGQRNGTLCNLDLARKELSLGEASFEELMGEYIPEEVLGKFF